VEAINHLDVMEIGLQAEARFTALLNGVIPHL
jgi:hypothetical protein